MPNKKEQLATITEALAPPQGMPPRPHQLSAIDAWAKAGGSGILRMATGSGKTFTALTIASRLYDRLNGQGLAILIVAPFIHLVDQWCAEARRFGLDPIRCAEGKRLWQDQLAAAIYALNQGHRSVLSIAVTQATLIEESFQEQIKRIRQHIYLIADEVHNYGTHRTIHALPNNDKLLKLGLSATPERWMDEEGTDALIRYFGPIVYQYNLKNAIDDGILSHYRYHPIIVELSEDEIHTYTEITNQLARRRFFDTDRSKGEFGRGDDDFTMKLLIRRARLLASAKSKLPKLKELMEPHCNETHILVYCGDGQVEVEHSEETMRQVEATVEMLHRDLRMRAAIYTADTPPHERQTLLRNFANGTIQVLVAIRCLDEGVDVPETRTAFMMASGTNPRQFIQRRGRVLRLSPGKQRANIYDFFVLPPLDHFQSDEQTMNMVRRLFLNQLDRAREFTELADNGAVARQVLLNCAQSLDALGDW